MAQPNLMRRRLGLTLRAARKRAGLTLTTAAGQVDVSTATLSRIELGKGPIPADKLDDYLAAYKLTGAKADEVKKLAALASSEGRSTLLTQYSDAIDDPFVGYLELEEIAARASIFTAQVVPGLLQTEEYAQALITAGVMHQSARQVRSFVELRMERQRVLRRENPLAVECIVEEGALRRPVGGAEPLRRQLHAVCTAMDELPNLDFRVIPTSAGAHPGVDGQFTIFQFDAGDPIVTVESMTRMAYLEEDYDLLPYDTSFGRMRELALSRERSREFIGELMQQL
ncbi:helix-turn-helix domain-containing protein [Streptomyces johnsoniae]|uniref:Helix-turn-helix transcriptional regulator n=1 Tax=Streptomyces johnsoniae TaxID=3075532 RepID=A0ABU2SFE8_9ACTN|nr:helix-turn-helix transcriptional regulator [Streptomyces sp. DSM 41886]MDT0446810.1 helix-turn-helix transcriptional regulator [Streptomyces sp. DSM 41886]